MAAVFITGGATGIGAASVRKFAANGFDVAVFDINAQAVADLAQEGHSGSITYFDTDVGQRSAVRRSIAAAAEQVGGPTTLFVNAGIQKLAGIFMPSIMQYQQRMACGWSGCGGRRPTAGGRDHSLDDRTARPFFIHPSPQDGIHPPHDLKRPASHPATGPWKLWWFGVVGAMLSAWRFRLSTSRRDRVYR